MELQGLVKIRGRTAVLRNACATFLGASIVSVEGANGAGKSTLLALLAGFSQPTRGAIRIFRNGASGEPVPASLSGLRKGLVDHEALLYPDLSIVENLRFFATLKNVGAKRVEESLHTFALEAIAERPIRRCSRGQKQRVALARALLNRPELLLLDEPDTGLDERSRQDLLTVLHRETARGCLSILVTHHARFAMEAGALRYRLHHGKLEQASTDTEREKGTAEET